MLNESLELIGRSGAWYPISLAPARTFIAFLSLIPVFAVFVLSWDLKRHEWGRALRGLVVFSVAMVLLGGLQMLTDNKALIFYPRERVRTDYLYGPFANHNSTGLYYVLALALLFAIGGKLRVRTITTTDLWSQWWVQVSVALLLVIAVVLTQSRSSMGVLFVVAGTGALGEISRRNMSAKKKALILVSVGVLSAASIFVLQGSSRFSEGLGRFDNLEDVRPAIWTDTVSSAERYWPIGSGIASFPEVFEVDEALENVWAFHAGRAHNDYLEIAQEGGIVGLMLVLAWIVWFVLSIIRTWNGEQRWHGLAAASGVAAVVLQSFVDYPLRNQAILCLGAVLVGFLARTAKGMMKREGEMTIARF
ncbi:hypothetical protein LK12_19320 [Novosphingobium malaysiense]|uniref:O-antigen ligase-related domain-containing protein n=1 Tax=Novosphingobium malaysiense TaxID=1348853 RepID=A0A0B1ZL88_9SPHN|nr:hypothetical protein LK12_19320 [Novosphingobium malaysiense]